MTTNATRLLNLSLAALAAASVMAGGCSTDNVTDELALPWAVPTPREAALDAANPYDADLRRRSISLLSAAPFGGEDVYVKLYRTLMDDSDPTVRAACIKAIGLHGEPKDVPDIAVQLNHPNHLVRLEAARALQKLHNPQAAVGPLIDVVSNEEEEADVKQAAARALGQYPQEKVFNTLVIALEEPDFGVVYAAHQSLKTLTGADMRTDSGDWLEWKSRHANSLFANKQTYTWEPYTKPGKVWHYVIPPFHHPDKKAPKLPAGYAMSDGSKLDVSPPAPRDEQPQPGG